MKLRLSDKGGNASLLEFPDGTEIFFSYGTAVAGYFHNVGYVKTEKRHSATTTRHIRNYLGTDIESTCKALPQAYFDSLALGA